MGTARHVWQQLPADLQSEAQSMQHKFCLITNQFFLDSAQVKAYWEGLGFVPRLPLLDDLDRQVLGSVSSGISRLAPMLMPTNEFYIVREKVRRRLETIVCSVPAVHQGTRLEAFGSSSNNFGSANGDLDMCLVPPAGALPYEIPGQVIVAIEEALTASGIVRGLSSRPTARIPVVTFRDLETDIECDISLENPLAIRNTRLLRVYSECDPRVRPLVYALKHWAKVRRVNNAQEGTLSSYGYILSLIYYLQTRNPPVLPNLQRLHPSWAGDSVDNSRQMSGHLPTVRVKHPVERVPVDTYFYDPGDTSRLRAFGARNTATVGELLAGFFRHMSCEFDYKAQVVSVNSARAISKLFKAERDCWVQHTRLSIEDPFETWYDVAHPVKLMKHEKIRAEYLRAYSMISEVHPPLYFLSLFLRHHEALFPFSLPKPFLSVACPSFDCPVILDGI